MIYLTGVSNETIREYAATQPRLGLMLEPQGAHYVDVPAYRGGFALDNGAFGAWRRGVPFDAPRWIRALDRTPAGALFVVVPDVVGSHDATLDAWHKYAPVVHDKGQRAAFVLQNGCRSLSDVPPDAGVVFIGGDDDFKMSDDTARIVWQARNAGLWTHMGRVNSSLRMRRAIAMGCDSTDGTFLRFGPRARMIAQVDRWLVEARDVGGQLDLTHHC